MLGLLGPGTASAQTLLLHYTFENGYDSSVQDVTGHGYTGTLVSGSLSSDAAQGAFSASLGRVELPNSGSSPAFSLPGDAFTIATWLKLPLVGSSLPSGIQSVFANTTPGYGKPGLQLYINSWQTANGAILMDLGGSTSMEASTGACAFPADGAWHQVTLSFNRTAGVASVYVDGDQRGSWSNLPQDFPVNTAVEVLGQTVGGYYQFQGLMDDFRIYQGALSADQVLALVPEPTFLSLLALGTLGLVWRRRRS